MLADFLNTENGIVVNLHVQAIDQSDAIKTVKRKITDLDAMKIQEQKRAVRSGYDMDILPSDLATYGQDAKELLKTLQSRNERMFQLTFLVLNTADTRQKLENDVFWAAGIAQKYNCCFKPSVWLSANVRAAGKASTRAKRTTTAETEAASLSCGRMTDFLRNGARRSPRKSPPRSLKTERQR